MGKQRGGVLFTTTIAESTEAFVNPVARELHDRGHLITLVTGDRIPRAPFPHLPIVIPMNRRTAPASDLHTLKEWTSLLRTLRPNLVVAGTPKASLLALAAARLASVPSRVYILHGAVWDGATGARRIALEAAERTSLVNATHTIAVSNSLARLVSTRRLARTRPEVVGSGSFCGVDTSRFRPELTKRRPGLICYVGRLNRDKGIDVLHRTFNRIRSGHPEARLQVIGSVDDSAPADSRTLREMAEDPAITMTGYVADVASQLQQADILLFPTKREGIGQVALEAQSCGVPVVSWRVTGIIDAVRDGFTGSLVSYGDEDSLARAATFILENANERMRLSSNARRWILDEFQQVNVASANATRLEHLALMRERRS